MSKRIVIVEDEFFVANHLKKIVETAGYTVVGLYHDGAQVLKDIGIIKNAIYLLDIQLSTEQNGIGIALALQELNVPFVYITANAEDGTFETALSTRPIAYISKPFKERDVLAGIALAFQQLKNTIVISSNGEKYIVNLDDILYLKSDNVYVTIYTKTKNYLLRKQLKDVAEDLTHKFKKCHRSYIVNMDKVSKTSSDTVFLDDIALPISRKYKEEF